MHYAKNITGYVISCKEFIAPHYLVIGRLLLTGNTVTIMKFPRAIETNSHIKAFILKETAPFLIEKCTVRLYTVSDNFSGRTILALYSNNGAKVIYPQKGRFTSMPTKVNYLGGAGFTVLKDIFF